MNLAKRLFHGVVNLQLQCKLIILAVWEATGTTDLNPVWSFEGPAFFCVVLFCVQILVSVPRALLDLNKLV
jgi:hypothetical protein